MGDIKTLEVQVPQDTVQYWGGFPAFGMGLLLLGIAAVARSIATTGGVKASLPKVSGVSGLACRSNAGTQGFAGA